MYFLRSTRPSTISAICGCISGSPPGIETIGAPHSSTALKQSSGERSVFRMWAGYWILPHPAQARLQRNSGSSISVSGYRFRPFSFCLRTYVATVHICEIGTGIFPAYLLEMDRGIPRPPGSPRTVETTSHYCNRECAKSARLLLLRCKGLFLRGTVSAIWYGMHPPAQTDCLADS